MNRHFPSDSAKIAEERSPFMSSPEVGCIDVWIDEILEVYNYEWNVA
jgi:hypothetical protein